MMLFAQQLVSSRRTLKAASEIHVWRRFHVDLINLHFFSLLIVKKGFFSCESRLKFRFAANNVAEEKETKPFLLIDYHCGATN